MGLLPGRSVRRQYRSLILAQRNGTGRTATLAWRPIVAEYAGSDADVRDWQRKLLSYREGPTTAKPTETVPEGPIRTEVSEDTAVES